MFFSAPKYVQPVIAQLVGAVEYVDCTFADW